tara:strand:- start:7008 stop:7139 length:132 start_codon:yes stop_codon:yes gene_type:complete
MTLPRWDSVFGIKSPVEIATSPWSILIMMEFELLIKESLDVVF